MTTVAATGPAQRAVHSLRLSRSATRKLLAGIPADKRCAQPGGCVNHALWVAGHLACTDDYFLNKFGGAPLALPQEWHTLFGMGSKPVSDASAYPAYDAVLTAMEARREALIAWFQGRSGAELETAGPEEWKDYAPTVEEVAHFASWHESYHGGQLSVLRKSLGLANAFS